MNKFVVSGLIGLVVGAAAGSTATWYILKTKYEQIAQEEIDSVKEVYSKKMAEKNQRLKEEYISKQEEPEEVEEKEEPVPEPIMKQYSSPAAKEDYTNYAQNQKEEKKEVKKEDADKPVVIPPDEFGLELDYEKLSIFYYADEVITDDDDNIIDDIEEIEETIGLESLEHFGEYEDEAVYVRNDKYKCYYEILLEDRPHKEIEGVL